MGSFIWMQNFVELDNLEGRLLILMGIFMQHSRRMFEIDFSKGYFDRYKCVNIYSRIDCKTVLGDSFDSQIISH